MYAAVMSAGSGSHQTNNVASNGNAVTSSLASNSLVELIEEGARFKDNYKSNSGQLKSAYSMLPCVYNSLPVPQVTHHTTAEQSSTSNVNPTTIVATSGSTIRQIPAVMSQTSSHSIVTSTPHSTSIDVKPDIKTFNLIRPPHSQPPKHKTHIQLTSQTQPQKVVQPIILHQQPSTQQQKQKIWISSLQNNKQQVTRPNIVPVPNTTYHIQSTSQPASSTVSSHALPKATSNGSPMYSVLYAGTGNKITIKRKPDPVDIKDYPNVRLNPPAVSSSANFISSTTTPTVFTDNKLPALVQTYHLPIPSTTTVRAHNPAQIVSHQFQSQNFGNLTQSTVQTQHHSMQPVFRPQMVAQYQQQQQQPTQQMLQQQQSFKKPVLARSKSAIAAAAAKRKGCRCGNATPTPGKLTCCGQRCPCYVDAKSCVDCKCRGCRNPHRADGLKVSNNIYSSVDFTGLA